MTAIFSAALTFIAGAAVSGAAATVALQPFRRRRFIARCHAAAVVSAGAGGLWFAVVPPSPWSLLALGGLPMIAAAATDAAAGRLRDGITFAIIMLGAGHTLLAGQFPAALALSAGAGCALWLAGALAARIGWHEAMGSGDIPFLMGMVLWLAGDVVLFWAWATGTCIVLLAQMAVRSATFPTRPRRTVPFAPAGAGILLLLLARPDLAPL